MFEIEEIHEVANCRRIRRNVRARRRNGVGQIVSAPRGQQFQLPVGLDKFQDRAVIVIRVIHIAFLCVRRNRDEGNPRAIAKEVDWLNVAES